MIDLLKRLSRKDPFVAQAREDQKTARYPGCEDGLMDCLDQCCACDELTPCRKFVQARAEILRRGALSD